MRDVTQFNPALQFVLRHEGGLANDKHDPGGITNKGISLRYLKALVKNYPNLMSKYDLDNSDSINPYDIKHMNSEEIRHIYLEYWWEKYGYGKINNQTLATKIFDLAVNMGSSKAVRLLQSACCSIAGYNCLKVDGVLGDKSIDYINQLDVKQQSLILEKLCQLAAECYQAIVKRRSIFKKFLKGWLKRAYAVPSNLEASDEQKAKIIEKVHQTVSP